MLATPALGEVAVPGGLPGMRCTPRRIATGPVNEILKIMGCPQPRSGSSHDLPVTHSSPDPLDVDQEGPGESDYAQRPLSCPNPGGAPHIRATWNGSLASSIPRATWSTQNHERGRRATTRCNCAAQSTTGIWWSCAEVWESPHPTPPIRSGGGDRAGDHGPLFLLYDYTFRTRPGLCREEALSAAIFWVDRLSAGHGDLGQVRRTLRPPARLRSVVVLLAGSVRSGLTQVMGQLIGYRALQGAGRPR